MKLETIHGPFLGRTVQRPGVMAYLVAKAPAVLSVRRLIPSTVLLCMYPAGLAALLTVLPSPVSDSQCT